MDFPENFPFIKINRTFINGLWMKIIASRRSLSSLSTAAFDLAPAATQHKTRNESKKAFEKLSIWSFEESPFCEWNFMMFVNGGFLRHRLVGVCGRGVNIWLLCPFPITRYETKKEPMTRWTLTLIRKSFYNVKTSLQFPQMLVRDHISMIHIHTQFKADHLDRKQCQNSHGKKKKKK